MAILANLFIDQGTDFSITVDVTDSNGESFKYVRIFFCWSD